MGIINIGGQWDETVCNMIACQHPPCWESMRRIESGHPHILLKNVAIPGRDFPASEDKLPTLKIVDLPLLYPPRERVKCVGGFDSGSKKISSSKEARNCFSNSILNDGWIIPPILVLSSERNPFPGLNSRMESQSLHFPPINFTCSRQPEKVQVAEPSEFVVHSLVPQPSCGSTVFRWVPDKRPRFPQSQNPNGRVKMPPQNICVKDLALENLLSLKDHQGAKRTKSNQVPTGGQPYFRYLKLNQKANNKSSSAGQPRDTDDGLLRTRQQLVHTLPLLIQNEGVTQGSKRGRSLQETKEKLAASFIVQKAPRFDRSEAKIPMKDKDSGRSLGRRPKIVSAGSLILRHLRAEQLGNAGNHQDKKGGGLLEHSQMSPESAAGNCKLQASPAMFAKRKSCVKFMEYKSNVARLRMEGCDPFASCLPKAEFRYRPYYDHLASWKEATPAERDASDFSREAWPAEDSQEAPKTFAPLQPPGPPPPSPSPLENSPNSPPGFP
ncbi:uncharacterized protein C9orf43 homolog [Notechis scutatus]|uniref:Uncharacterized protein C9orf43 homolog n=1 Tax=Notechis scutatus TaxID=8663 RepID=A0A6J1VGR9_9SAUR|nr:uncharacterized protein C9orf43 homolog [Notechis scutatus]